MLWVRIGVYHTQFSVAYFLLSTLLSKIFDQGQFDVGDRDLPVLTSGNWVIKGWVIKWPVNLRTFFYVFLTFFSKSKKHDFLRFFSGWPRFLEHCRNLVLYCTVSEILQVFFCSWPHPYCILILGCSRCFCRRKVRLSQKTARKRRQSPISATVALRNRSQVWTDFKTENSWN